MSMAACKLPFCFAGFTNTVSLHVTAISGAVNIARGLFKKANDLKCCGVFSYYSSFLFHLNYLQEAGPPKRHVVLTHFF